MSYDTAREVIANFLDRYGEDQTYRQAEVLLGKLDDGGVVLNGITDDEWSALAMENERLRAAVKDLRILVGSAYEITQRALDVSGKGATDD